METPAPTAVEELLLSEVLKYRMPGHRLCGGSGLYKLTLPKGERVERTIERDGKQVTQERRRPEAEVRQVVCRCALKRFQKARAKKAQQQTGESAGTGGSSTTPSTTPPVPVADTQVTAVSPPTP